MILLVEQARQGIRVRRISIPFPFQSYTINVLIRIFITTTDPQEKETTLQTRRSKRESKTGLSLEQVAALEHDLSS